MAKLEIESPDGTERDVELSTRPISLGRAGECDVVLDEQKASRRHCRIEPHGGGWRVVDEGSSNGTWLGGKPVLAARLKPDDEIEIGETVIRFEDDSAHVPVQRAPRRSNVKKNATPWGALVVPVIAAAVAIGLVLHFDKSEGAEVAAAHARYAKAEVERASFQKDSDKRLALLQEARDVLWRGGRSDAAIALLDEAIRGPGKKDDPNAPSGTKTPDDWRPAVEAFDADTAASSGQRRTRLADLLDRHMDDAEAVAALRERIRTELTSSGERARQERERTFAEADQAVLDGRFGQALDIWAAWVRKAPPMSEDDDRGIAQRLSDIIEKSRAAAEAAAEQYETARKAGREEAAQSALDAAAERLRGTGFDVWLAARGGVSLSRRPTGGAPDKPEDATTKERTRALQLQGMAEALARQRRFDEAAAKMDEAAAGVSEAGLKSVITLRAGDVRREAAFLVKLLGAIGAEPAKFSPVKMGDRMVRVDSATPTDIAFVATGGAPDAQPVTDVPSPVFVQLVDKAALEPADFVSAALLLRDLGEMDAFTKWMRAALPDKDDAMRAATSEVYARCIGQKLPDGGYWPHPRDGKSIVTLAEKKAIENAEVIAKLTGDLVKVVDKIEKSKQAKQVANVREAYLKLEKARKNALALIFDEQRYFYPYRDRMREYAPVQKEVDDLVKLVRDAWEDPTKERVRTDAALEKLRAESDKLITDIQYYGGFPNDLVERIDNVVKYLPSAAGAAGQTSDTQAKDLTVQTFWETKADLDLMGYNARVLKYNPSVKGPTDPERRQVEVTNEYRIMFGHRRAVRINPMLVQSARGHSEDMSKLGFFDHFSPVPGKRTPDDRMRLAGYEGAGSSENIYSGSGAPESAHEGWIHSSGHHRNILMPGWLEMGSGCSGHTWTQNFGFRIDDNWEPTTPGK